MQFNLFTTAALVGMAAAVNLKESMQAEDHTFTVDIPRGADQMTLTTNYDVSFQDDAFDLDEQEKRQNILDGEFLYIEHSPIMDKDRMWEKMITMDDRTRATAVANSEIDGLQIGGTYEVVSATPGENNRYSGSVVVKRVDATEDEEDISMNWKAYRTSFTGTKFTHDGWAAKEQFRVQDDQTESVGQETWHDTVWCGPTCVKHKFAVTSDVDQKVIITANTLPKHPDQCNPKENWNLLRSWEAWYGTYSEDKFTQYSQCGQAMYNEFNMTAGQRQGFQVQLDYETGDIARDFSIVVYGEDGSVTLENIVD